MHLDHGRSLQLAYVTANAHRKKCIVSSVMIIMLLKHGNVSLSLILQYIHVFLPNCS